MSKRRAQQPAFQVTLNADQLQHLGMVLVVWGQIDAQIINAISDLLEIKPKAAIALLENVTSGTLVNYLRKHRSKTKDTSIEADIKTFVDNMGWLIEKRNHLSHGTWGWYATAGHTHLTPGCHYHKAGGNPLLATDIPEILACAMAESRAITSIATRLAGKNPRPEDADPARFFFGSGPPSNTLPEAPLQPGSDHQLIDQNWLVSPPPDRSSEG